MTEKKTRTKLGLVLVICTVMSFAAATILFFALDLLSEHLIEHVVFKKEKIIETEKRYFYDLIETLNAEKKLITDEKAVREWLQGKKDVMIAVYDANSQLPAYETRARLYSHESDPLSMYSLLQEEYADYWYSGAVWSSGDLMRSRIVKVMYYPMYRAQRLAMLLDAVLSILAFVLIVFACVRRKTKYIALLSRELQAMQSGDLVNPITVRGNDELTTLAQDIDDMRKSFIERLENEERMQKSSSELLTAMSHDLRTPLTSLIGYLDIVDLGKCESPEQEKKYIHSGKLKAYQIKEMTDKLFEYFLVYASKDDTLETETLDAGLVFSQLWAESSLILETEGYTMSVSESGEGAAAEVNVLFLRRVFDNIVSNIRKYADRDEPVIVTMRLSNGRFETEISNAVGKIEPRGESSGIGLASCKKIAESHGGGFTHERRDGRFIVRFYIPVSAA